MLDQDGPAQDRRALIIAGPTASGKSALALALARAWGGMVINADSMQIYRELPIITARPTPEEEAQAPHRLYGVRAAAEPASAAWWRAEALAAMVEARAQGLIPILCGGTGLYFAALKGGLAEIPEPGEAARGEARALLAQHGAAWLHAALAEADPASAARLRPSDGQRVARAWEVWRGTGVGMAEWIARGQQLRAPWNFASIRLDPPRDLLRTAIAARFARMVQEGAVEEVAALLAQNPDPGLPAMRALGVPEIGFYLKGERSLGDAVGAAVLASGQYTKRQATWFRHHELADLGPSHIIYARFAGLAQFSERILGDFLNFLKN